MQKLAHAVQLPSRTDEKQGTAARHLQSCALIGVFQIIIAHYLTTH